MEKILLTGASGFLGREISKHLKSLNYKVVSLGRNKSNAIVCDLGSETPVLKECFDIVIHVAGKAHTVPKNEQEKLDFYKVNRDGTKSLLKCLEIKLPKTVIFISTVAVYGVETGEMITEEYPLKGETDYAKSKILAENLVQDFGKKYNVNTIILRPPLITGKSPAGNLGAIMKFIKKGFYFRIGKGDAKRSMVSAIDIARIIPYTFNKNGVYNLTDRIHPTFSEIDTYIGNYYGKSINIMPSIILKYLAKIGDIIPLFPLNSMKFDKMTKSLTFNDDKAVRELGWNPIRGLSELKE